MTARFGWLDAGAFFLALLLALLWPLSAYAVGPVALPLLLIGALCLVVVLREPHYGVALALALAPFANLPFGGARPIPAVISGLVVGLLAYGALTPRATAPRMPAFALAAIAFACVSAGSALLAVDPAESISELYWITMAVALLLATLRVCRERAHLIVVAGGAVAGLVLAAAQGVVQEVTGVTSAIEFVADGEVVNRVSGSFGHPNQYAAFLAMMLPLSGSIVVSRGLPGGIRVLAGLAVSLAVPALVFSYTRGAVIGLVLGLLIWLAVLRPRAVIGVAVVMALSAVFLAPPALKDRFQADSGGDVTLRSDIWSAALDLYSQRPVFGVGLNNFERSYTNLASTPTMTSQRRLLHNEQILVPPHAQNQFLNVLAEEGTLGIVTFGLLGLTGLAAAYRGARVRDAAGRAISLGVGAGLVVLAIHGQLDVPMFGERIEMPLLALLGVVTVFVRLDDEHHGSPSSDIAS